MYTKSFNDEPIYLIGLDLGTSSIKGVLMSLDGAIVSREKAETQYDRGEGGIVEFDAEQFYTLIARVIRRLTDSLPDKAAIAGLSMASASGNTLLIDGSGKPMLPAVSWMDTRVTDEMEQVYGRLDGKDVHSVTGWTLSKMFPLAHLAWLRCHRPETLESASRVCMTTDYVNYRLTGCWGIDTSTATTFFLQDQSSARWHLPYLRLLGIPEEKLPPIFPSGTLLGGITERAALETGLPQGTPVVLGSFDHPSAARGSGVCEEGQLLISCGTSWVAFLPVRDRKLVLSQDMLVDPFLANKGLWGAITSLPAIGVKVDKYVRRYISDASDRYSEFDRLSALSKPGAGGLAINPMLEDQTVDTGLYGKADIARAIMEGTAYLLKEKIEGLRAAGTPAASVTMVGGPSETFPWPQILCDILGMKLSIVNGSCAGAAGAAILAGIGVGLYSDEKDALGRVRFDEAVRLPAASMI